MTRLRAVAVVALCAAFGVSLAARQTPALPPLMRPADVGNIPRPPADHQVAYGDDPNQIAELRLPSQAGPHPVVVLVHGGCWLSQAPRYLAAIGDALKRDGIASWNIEYRRLGQAGGGWPGTYRDVGRAIDHLRELATSHNLDLNRVIVVGHSAGGHLAMWAATRQRIPPSSALFIAKPLSIRGVINLAGTVDMTANIADMEEKCRGPVVTDMLGGVPAAVPARYREVSANTMLPLGVPQILIWGEHEDGESLHACLAGGPRRDSILAAELRSAIVETSNADDRRRLVLRGARPAISFARSRPSRPARIVAGWSASRFS